MKLIAILLCLGLVGCATTHYSFIDYYEYGKELFHFENHGWYIGDDDIFAHKLAIDLYEHQVNLDELKRDLNKKIFSKYL